MESRELMDYFDEYSIRISISGAAFGVRTNINGGKSRHLAFENYVIMALE